MPYYITACAFKSVDDHAQLLAVGMVDGAVVVIDVALGFEKHFLAKHPRAITALAFWEDKCLMSGSMDG